MVSKVCELNFNSRSTKYKLSLWYEGITHCFLSDFCGLKTKQKTLRLPLRYHWSLGSGCCWYFNWYWQIEPSVDLLFAFIKKRCCFKCCSEKFQFWLLVHMFDTSGTVSKSSISISSVRKQPVVTLMNKPVCAVVSSVNLSQLTVIALSARLKIDDSYWRQKNGMVWIL